MEKYGDFMINQKYFMEKKRYVEFDFSKIEEKEEYKEQGWFSLFSYLIRKERFFKKSNVNRS